MKDVLIYELARGVKMASLMNDGDDISTAMHKVCGLTDLSSPFADS